MNITDDDDFDLEDWDKFVEKIDKVLADLEEDFEAIEILKYSTFSEIPPYQFLLIETIIHSCICAVGYVGNIITCIVIVSNVSMHTTTNIYLFNLAIADLIMLSSGLINYTIASWYPYKLVSDYGMKGCFFFNWVSDVAVNVAIMTITAFTIERYIAICRPLFARVTLSISKAVKLILFIWLIGIIFGYSIYSQQDIVYLAGEITPICFYVENTMRYIAAAESLIFFILPFILMAALYILIWKKLVDSSKIQKNQGSSNIEPNRSEVQYDDANRQILKMLVTVVAVFFFVWAPYHFGRLFLLFLTDLPTTFRDTFIDIDLFLESTYLIVYFSSSAINPIIYNVMSKKFRHAFKKVFKCWDMCQKKRLTNLRHKHSRRRRDTETIV